MRTLICGAARPDSGDLVLARVDEVCKQKRLELTDGRKALLFPGDEILVAYGNRYAPDQYEAVIGNDLGPCDLVAAGGVAAKEISRNLRMIEPTKITPIGLVGDAQARRLNLRAFALPDYERQPRIPVVLSLGTSMNAGKTLTATSLVRGLKKAGLRVAAIKATGTGSGNDQWIVRDAGADLVLDFTDAGFSGTYLIPQPDIEAGARRLLGHAAAQGCDIAIVEIADGLQHLETAALIEAMDVWRDVVGVVFAAYDAMGAKCGVEILQSIGHRVLAVSGRITLSPLAMREAQRATGLRSYTPSELQEGALVDVILGHVGERDRLASIAQTAAAGAGPRPGEPWGTVMPFPADARADPSDGRLPRALIPALLGRVARHVMGAEADALCGASHGVRGSRRINRRNGYRQRRWATCLGEVALAVPRLRKGGYHPAFLTATRAIDDEFARVADRCFEIDMPASALLPLLTLMGAAPLPDAELVHLKEELNAVIRDGRPAVRVLPFENDAGRTASRSPWLPPSFGDDVDEDFFGVAPRLAYDGNAGLSLDALDEMADPEIE